MTREAQELHKRMRLFRVRCEGSMDWSLVLAEDEDAVIAMMREDMGDFDRGLIWQIVEYLMDKPMILPAGWMSE